MFRFTRGLVVLSLVLNACGSSTKSDSSDSATTNDLMGTWTLACTNVGGYYEKGTLTVTDTKYTKTLKIYSDAACTTESGKEEEDIQYVIGASLTSPAGAKKLDLTILGTVFMRTIYLVDAKTLKLGTFSVDYDGSTEAKRPIALDTKRVYTKS